MDKSNKINLLISLILHILVLIAITNLRSSNVLSPSRSNGMEIDFVASSDLPQITNTVVKNQQKYQLDNNNGADIVVKQAEKTSVLKKEQIKPIEKPITKPQPPIKAPQKPLRNKQITELLENLVPSQNAGHSNGSAIGGSNIGTADTDNQLSNYADLVIAKVRPFVIIPMQIAPNAQAIVEVTLHINMNVYSVKLIKSSGNHEYDDNVCKAIERVKVFPPLPQKAKFTDFRKIRLTFRPQ